MKRARKKGRKEKFTDRLSPDIQDRTSSSEGYISESDIPFYVDDDVFDSQTNPETIVEDTSAETPETETPSVTDEFSSDEFITTEEDLSTTPKHMESKSMKSKKKKKKKNRLLRRIITITLCILLFIVIAVFLLGSQLLSSCISGSQISNEDDIYEYLTQVDSTKIEKLEKINVLLLGVDKDGERSDSIMLVNYNVKTHKINLMSIPRDTRMYVEDRGIYRKITEIHGMHKKNGEMYGAAAVANAVIELTGMPINYYMEFSFDAVDSIMDILGPVTFDVPDLEGKGRGMNYDDPYQDLHIHLKPGIQNLSGNQIQQFLRYRKSNYGNVDGSDLNRVKRQQELLAAIMDQKLNATLVTKIPDILDEVNEGLKTTFTSEDIVYYSSYLLKNLNNISSENMDSYVLPGETDMISGISYFVCDLDATAELVNTTFGHEVDADDLSNVVNLTTQKSSGKIKTTNSGNKSSSSSSTKKSTSGDDDNKKSSSDSSKKTSSEDDKDSNSEETTKKNSSTKKDTEDKDDDKETSTTKKSTSDDDDKKNSSDSSKKTSDDDDEDSDSKETVKETSSSKKDDDESDKEENKKTSSSDSSKKTSSSDEEKTDSSSSKSDAETKTDEKSSSSSKESEKDTSKKDDDSKSEPISID